MAINSRPSARATQTVTSDELAMLRAKAAVCDAYRDWLDTPTHKTRKPLTIALLGLAALERQNIKSLCLESIEAEQRGCDS